MSKNAKRFVSFLLSIMVTLSLAACSSDPAPQQSGTESQSTQDATNAEENKADVVVVGAGGAGMTAALNVAYAGKKVIVVEKMAFTGGTTAMASTNFVGVESQAQKDQGIAFTKEDLKNELMTKNSFPEWTASVMAENSGACADWLVSLGVDLTRVDNNRDLKPVDGSSPGILVVKALENEMKKQNVDYRLETKATKILMEDGKAVGIAVDGPDGSYTIEAPAVIIATGGFGANADLVSKSQPDYTGFSFSCAVSNTGDGILMAEEAGAGIKNMEVMSTNPSVHFAENGSLASMYVVRTSGAIMVNETGKRFVNETTAVNTVALEMKNNTKDGSAWLVFDQSIVDANSSVQKYKDQGYLVSAPTIEELAALIEVPADALAQTVTTYQGYAAAGTDQDFGRASMQMTFSTAPFYAVKVAPAVQSTRGGIVIDATSRVLNTSGEVIPGLYAAGETTATGTTTGSMSSAVVFGKLAGLSALEDLG